MFRPLRPIFRLNIKEYTHHSAIKWTISRLHKVFMAFYYIYSFVFSHEDCFKEPKSVAVNYFKVIIN